MDDCPASSAAAVSAFPALHEHQPSAKKRRLAGTPSSALSATKLPAGPPKGAAAAAAAAARAVTPERFSAILLGTGASNRVPRLDHVLSQECEVRSLSVWLSGWLSVCLSAFLSRRCAPLPCGPKAAEIVATTSAWRCSAAVKPS